MGQRKMLRLGTTLHVGGLVPLSPHCHRPAVYFRPSGSCPSWGGVVAFAPESPAAPWGMASTGKAWEEESPTACPAPKPRAHPTSLAKGKGLGWVAATVPGHPLGGNIPSPEWQRAGGCEMEGTASIWPGAVGKDRDTQLICFPRPLQPPQNCPPCKKVKIRVEN